VLGLVLAVVMPAVVVGVARLAGVRDGPLPALLLAGYTVRLVLQVFMRDLPIFSYGTGGDYLLYESTAATIARMWDYTGAHFVTGDEIPYIATATLPVNLFALIDYVNGEPTRLGCTAVVAALGCLTALNIERLAHALGATPAAARGAGAFLLFGPSFALFTSDLYKDGIALFLVSVAFGSSLQLSRRFSVRHTALGACALLALWYVRFYMIFVTLGPLFVGLAGLRSRAAWRPVVTALAMAVAAVTVVGLTDVLGVASETANTAFDFASGEASQEANASGGSGVTFRGGPTDALGLKLLYTLFAPFPWQSGSVAMQLGKLEALVWYYVMYLAARAAARLWRQDRPTLLTILVFIGPTTVMYASTLSNVGLVVRERMPIVMVVALLATLRYPRTPASVPASARRTVPAWPRLHPQRA
jgi:hypothetical protein